LLRDAEFAYANGNTHRKRAYYNRFGSDQELGIPWSPKEDDLLKCKDKEDAENCTAIDTAQYCVKVLPVVALPPLLLALLLQVKELDPIMELMHLINKAAPSFDEERAELSTSNEIATKAVSYYQHAPLC
jgi:hypothetical protein